MLVDYNRFMRIMGKYFDSNRQANLKITNRCPVMCAHCRECSTADSDAVVTKETIDKVVQQIVDTGEPQNWIVPLMGGEALLYPDLCEYAIRACKEAKIATNVYTSGFWWRDKEKYFKLLERWQPETFCLSVNDWTVAKFGGIEYANEIAEFFARKDNPIILNYSEVYIDRPKYYNKLKYKSALFQYEAAPVGRAKQLVGKYDNPHWMCHGCELSGFWIETDGTIFGNCPATIFGCKFGTVYGTSLADIYKMGRKDHCWLQEQKDYGKA